MCLTHTEEYKSKIDKVEWVRRLKNIKYFETDVIIEPSSFCFVCPVRNIKRMKRSKCWWNHLTLTKVFLVLFPVVHDVLCVLSVLFKGLERVCMYILVSYQSRLNWKGWSNSFAFNRVMIYACEGDFSLFIKLNWYKNQTKYGILHECVRLI